MSFYDLWTVKFVVERHLLDTLDLTDQCAFVVPI